MTSSDLKIKLHYECIPLFASCSTLVERLDMYDVRLSHTQQGSMTRNNTQQSLCRKLEVYNAMNLRDLPLLLATISNFSSYIPLLFSAHIFPFLQTHPQRPFDINRVLKTHTNLCQQLNLSWPCAVSFILFFSFTEIYWSKMGAALLEGRGADELKCISMTSCGLCFSFLVVFAQFFI